MSFSVLKVPFNATTVLSPNVVCAYNKEAMDSMQSSALRTENV